MPHQRISPFKTLSAVLVLAALTFSASLAKAGTVTCLSGTGCLNPPDVFDWARNFGAEYNSIPNGSVALSNAGNLAAQINFVGGGDGMRIDQGSGWLGNFRNGDALLWTNSPGQGPVTFTFNHTISGLGAQVQADFLGPFTMQLLAFDTQGNLLDSVSEAGMSTSNADGSAISIGIADSRGIASAEFIQTSCPCDTLDFSIGPLGVVPTPEPGSLGLSFAVLLLMALCGRHRRRQEMKPALAPVRPRKRRLILSTRSFQIRPAIGIVCIAALVYPSVTLAVTNDGYGGNTIAGRPSIAVVNAPGGTKVNTLLGNLFLSRSELRIPGRGLPLEVQSTYNSNQNAIAGPLGFGWTFNYGVRCLLSASRNVVVEWADGRSDLFQYRAGIYTPYNSAVFSTLALAGNLLQLTTKEQIRFFFDTTHGMLQRMQDPNGNALTFAYAGSELTMITDASGRSISLAYDANGHITQITDPNGTPARVLRYSYDATGNQTGFTDQMGNITSYSYDSGHRLVRVSDPLGVTRISYGLPNMSVASVSRSTPANTVLSTRSFTYNLTTLTTTVTDQLTNSSTASTTYQYDSKFKLIQTTDPLGHVDKRSYDSYGNIASATDPNGNVTAYTYDSEGNILSITDPLGHVTGFTYNPVYNKVTSMTDANGHTTSYMYDSQGNLAMRQDPLGNITHYAYDSVGQLVSRQNARGLVTTFAYNSNGDQTAITDPLGRSRTFSYDAVGNRLSRTDGNHQTTSYSYDARNRLIRTLYPDATQATFTYDPHDNVLTAADPNTDLRFVYDANERTVHVADNRLAKTISYQYDGVGNRIQMVDPEGAITSYTYDLASRLSAIGRNSQQFTFNYDNGGRLTGSGLPNGASTNYSYDHADRLLSLINQKSGNGVISSFAYQYDNAGNRSSMALAGGDTVNYGYDGSNQLVHETRTGSTAYDHRFTYDSVGNRTQLNAGGVITSYSYDNADELTQETTGSNSTVYGYEGNGNRATRTIGSSHSAYIYDFNNRLIRFSSPNTSASYVIDALGRRASKTVGGSTTRFFYDGQDIIADYDGSGSLQSQNLFGAGIDNNLAQFTGGTSLYYLHDGINSVRNILDAAQTVQNIYDYDAWGNMLANVENVANRYTFTGRESDRESGLYYYRARAYDSSNGRFNQSDPIDFNLGTSPYSYASNSPVIFVDPSGQSWAIPALLLGLLILLVVLWPLCQCPPAAPPPSVPPPTPPPPPPPPPVPPAKPKPFKTNYTAKDFEPAPVPAPPSDSDGSNGAGCTGGDGSYGQGSQSQ